MATTGIQPTQGGGPALIDQTWLLGLAGGLNNASVNSLVATAGGTKAAGYQIPAATTLVAFATVASSGDSALLPQALKNTYLLVYNGGAQNLSLYGKGTDTINAVATASAYTLATTAAALFFCAKDGNWGAIKTA